MFPAVSLAAVGAADAQTITRAPAFNAERLSTLPRDEWITNGGTIANQRYSPLDLINRGNVAGLKGVWRTGLENGAQLYRETCLPCHGPDGGGGAGGGAPLTSALTRETALAVMIGGRNTMPAFGELYTPQQMRDIAAYVVERLAVGRQ
jgi:mono/diheme cytochrome c family protein